MSLFTKRRKIVRQKQEEDRIRWEENRKKQNESMDLIIKTATYIDENHPEFDSLEDNDRIKLFAKVYNKIQNGTKG